MNRGRTRSIATVVIAAIAAFGCSGGDDDGAAPTTETTETAEEASTTSAREATSSTRGPTTSLAATTAPASKGPSTTGAIADPDDDANDDGVLDPFCGEQDFGAGLILKVHCDLDGLTSEVPSGVTLVEGSLLRLRSSIHRNMDGISGNLIVSRDPAGGRVFVIVFQSDALFETGSASIESTESFDNVAAMVGRDFPGSTIQVRGHTDSTGDPASNQTLSEARAQQVRSRLLERGVPAPDVTALGFGETRPTALDDTEEGRAFNRRVEVVLRPRSG